MSLRTTLRRPIWAVAALGIGSAVAMTPGAVLAQDTTPPATPAEYAEQGAVSAIISDANGQEIGAAVFLPTETGVHVEVQVTGLPEGTHGIHVHETGVCDPSGDKPFDSAGGHFNPTSDKHGAPLLATPGATPMAGEEHAGDLGNIIVNADGTGSLSFDTSLFVLDQGADNSLRDQDGSAIVIHANADDLMTDPSGNSADRIACGVVFAPEGSATPIAPPATPTS